jgi:hypothetical protein
LTSHCELFVLVDFSTCFTLRSFNDEASRKGAKEPKKLSLPSLGFLSLVIYFTDVGGNGCGWLDG